MKITRAIIAIFLVFAFVQAGERTFTINFEKSNITFSKVEGYDYVSYKGIHNSTRIGEPSVPVKSIAVLIPADAIYREVKIDNITYIPIRGTYRLYPVQKPVPISFKVNSPFVAPQKSIYEKDSFYPNNLLVHTHSGDMSGFRIEDFLLYPVVYNPVKGELKMVKQITFTVKYENGKRMIHPSFRRQVELFKKSVRSLVINPTDVDIFAPPTKN